MTSTQAFWIDDDYDQDRASERDGSRFLAYVRQVKPDELTGADWLDGPDPVVTARQLWRIATPPVMAPGYVRRHPRILAAEFERNEWDGSLLADVTVATGWPAELRQSLDWRLGRWWRDWSRDLFNDRLEGPESSQDLTGHPYMLAQAQLLFPLPHDGLPTDNGPSAIAHEVIRELVIRLNQVVTPIVETLEGVHPEPASRQGHRTAMLSGSMATCEDRLPPVSLADPTSSDDEDALGS